MAVGFEPVVVRVNGLREVLAPAMVLGDLGFEAGCGDAGVHSDSHIPGSRSQCIRVSPELLVTWLTRRKRKPGAGARFWLSESTSGEAQEGDVAEDGGGDGREEREGDEDGECHGWLLGCVVALLIDEPTLGGAVTPSQRKATNRGIPGTSRLFRRPAVRAGAA